MTMSQVTEAYIVGTVLTVVVSDVPAGQVDTSDPRDADYWGHHQKMTFDATVPVGYPGGAAAYYLAQAHAALDQLAAEIAARPATTFLQALVGVSRGS